MNMRWHLRWSLCCFFFLFCIVGEVWAGFSGYEKVLDTSLLKEGDKNTGEYVDVIVTLASGDSPGGGNGFQVDEYTLLSSLELQRRVIGKMSKNSGVVRAQLESMPIFSASVTGEGLKELAAMGEVFTIERNWPVEVMTRQGIPLISAERLRMENGGKGVSIAIVDTGMNYNHPALGGPGFPNNKVIGGFDIGDDDPDPMEDVTMKEGQISDSMHGTSCGAIAAGINTGIEQYIGGVAPEAKLYAVKIWDNQGAASLMSILKAWDWCVTHQYDDPENPIMIISNSLGNPTLHSERPCDQRFPSWSQMAAKVVSKGIALFVSSGNEGQARTISAPSCLGDAISVGAVFDDDINENARKDRVAGYSNTSMILDLLAPSHNAATASSPGNIYTANFGGTSAACPYAAGAAALLQSEYKRLEGRFLTVKELRFLLVASGDRITDPRTGVRKPRVNVEKALALMKKGNWRKSEKPKQRKDDNIIDDYNKTLENGGASKTVIDF